MWQRFLNIFEPYSFWLGFLVASLFWWIMGRFMPVFRSFFANVTEQAKSARETAKAGVEYHYLNDLYKKTQALHLAAPIFALDEILIEPRMMAMPHPMTDGDDDEGKHYVDITLETIPYMPDWPEMAAVYHAPTFSLEESLLRGTQLVLIGNAGSGKTVALARLASKIARGTPQTGELNRLLPILIHIGDLPATDLEANEPVKAIYAALMTFISSRTSSKILPLLENAFSQGRVLLMLDGMDELDRASFDASAGFIETIMRKYPGTRIVATASPHYYDGLTQLGLVPVAIASWNPQQFNQFIENWGTMWTNNIQREIWKFSPNGSGEPEGNLLNATILNNWVEVNHRSISPLEVTLKTWAAYAGDSLGPTFTHAIDAYIRRMTVETMGAGIALERIALQMMLKMTVFPSETSASRWARGITMDDAEESIIPEIDDEPEVEEKPDDSKKEAWEDMLKKPPVQQKARNPEEAIGRQMVPGLIKNGLFTKRADARVGFSHPTIGGYISGKALASAGGSSWVQNQPAWTGKHQALQFLANFGSPIGATASLSNASEDIIRQRLLFAARWLPESLAHPKAPWRVGLMRELFNIISGPSSPIGLRGRALSALLISKDPGIPAMCRRLIQHENPDIRRIGILGLGYLKDDKSVKELGDLLYDPDKSVQRATCLALVAISNQEALEAVATALLHGDEHLQRAAAEALSNNKEEGYPTLKEASEIEDLLPRRASAFGLARIPEPWARERLEEMRALDKEWIVRNAADDMATQLDLPKTYVPEPVAPLHEVTWLLVFAAKSGEGIAPGAGAEATLQRALMGGTDIEKTAAMHHLQFASREAGESAISILYGIFMQDYGEFQEAAYRTLWHLSLAGHHLPSPIKFGIGTQNW